MRIRHPHCASASMVVLAAVSFATDIHAQEAPARGSDTAVEEIIVTAQRREQSLQDVPIVVTSVSAKLLQDAGVKDIKDLTILTPGLMVTSTSNETVTSARIRGVGTVGDNPGLESSVGVLVDGVYRPRNGVGFGDLGELQRIEVLKGPQGTLFGKNTSAGVINILTKPPEFELGAESEATVGNYGAVGFSGSLTGPISDTVAARIYAAVRQRDGFQDIGAGVGPRSAGDDNDQNYYTVRGQLLFRPSDALNVRLIADYTKRDENCCVGVQIVNGPFAPLINALGSALGAGPGVLIPPDADQRLAYANRSTAQQIEDRGVSAEINWRTPWLGGATLTSVTAARKWDTVNGQDSDFTALDILYRPPNGLFFRDFKQFSQELRLAGETGRASWLIGGFYAKEDLDSGEPLLHGANLELYIDQLLRAAAVPGSAVKLGGLQAITGRPLGSNYVIGAGQNDLHAQRSESYAVFGNLSFKLTDKLEATGGLRFTSEDKTLDSQYRNTAGGAAGGVGPNPCALSTVAASAALGGPLVQRLYAGYYCAPNNDRAYDDINNHQSRSDHEFSGTAKLAYRFNDDLMSYVSYARGYKAGGFNLDRVRVFTNPFNPSGIGVPNLNTSFPAEFVDSWELGAKSSWFGRSLLVNAALFHQTFKDYQLNAFDGVAFTVTSIPKVVSRGVDADVIWRTPLEGFSIQGGVTYAVTQYADGRPATPVFALPSPANPTGGGLYRLPGSRISFAPLWSGSLAGAYEREVGSYKFRASLAAKYTSNYNTGSDLSPLKMQKELMLLNGRIGWGSADERWTFEVWGQNLTNKTYLQVAFDGTFQPNQVDGFLGAPRTYGATLRFKY
jgi:outer membrane receptor protein involved in Fe transport